jgi:8-oxo-dGTP diphosphatase
VNTGNANKTKPSSVTRVVGAAIISNGKILCAQRGESKSLAGYWEFPGGKVEKHETLREALHREIEEELLCEIDVDDTLCTTMQSYDFGTIELTTFMCSLLKGLPTLTEHQQIRWLAPGELASLRWAPADCEAVAKLSNASPRNILL